VEGFDEDGDEMNAQTYLMATTRLAYYEAMKTSAPVRDLIDKPIRQPRKRQKQLEREKPAILLQPGNQNA